MFKSLGQKLSSVSINHSIRQDISTAKHNQSSRLRSFINPDLIEDSNINSDTSGSSMTKSMKTGTLTSGIRNGLIIKCHGKSDSGHRYFISFNKKPFTAITLPIIFTAQPYKSRLDRGPWIIDSDPGGSIMSKSLKTGTLTRGFRNGLIIRCQGKPDSSHGKVPENGYLNPGNQKRIHPKVSRKARL